MIWCVAESTSCWKFMVPQCDRTSGLEHMIEETALWRSFVRGTDRCEHASPHFPQNSIIPPEPIWLILNGTCHFLCLVRFGPFPTRLIQHAFVPLLLGVPPHPPPFFFAYHVLTIFPENEYRMETTFKSRQTDNTRSEEEEDAGGKFNGCIIFNTDKMGFRNRPVNLSTLVRML